jgi:PAS domain S-box-containing protein
MAKSDSQSTSDQLDALRARIDQLEIEKERYFSLVEKAKLAIIVAQGGRLRYVNPQACSMVGRSAEELYSEPMEVFIHPDDRKLVLERHRRRMQGESLPETATYRVLHADGSMLWAEISVINHVWDGKPATLALLNDVTERMQAGRDLFDSEKRYRLLAEHSSDVIWSYDLNEKRLTYVSPSVERVFGYTADEAMELPMEAWNPPKSLEKLFAALNEELILDQSGKGHGSREIEIVQFHKDGTRIPIGITASLVRNGQGHPTAVVGVSRNISERKRAEEALRSREALLASIYKAAPVGIGVVDANRVIAWANDHLCEMTGYSQRELEGMPARKLYPSEKEYLRVGREKHADVRAKGVGSIETVWQRKDGSRMDIDLTSSILGGTDISQGMVFTALDITRREKAESELQTSYERLKILYDRSPVMLHSLDRNHNLISVNDRWLEVMGYQRAEVIGRPFSDFLIPESQEFFRSRAWPAFLDAGWAKDVTYQMVKKDGGIIDVIINAASERDKNGKVLRTISVVEDVTERKAAERERKQFEERFETVFKTSPVWVSITTVEEGRFLMVNDTFSKITGFSKEETIGRTSYDLGFWMGSDDRERAVDLYRKRGYFRNLEMTMHYKDGIPRNMLWSVDPIEYDGETCWLNVLTDITERKEAELALEQSEEKFRILFDQMVSGFALHEIICDSKGDPIDYRFLEVNPAFERHTGLSRDKVSGKKVTEILPGIDKELIQTYGKVALSGEPIQFELFSPELDRHYEISAFSPRHGQFAVTFSDITARKEAEKQQASLEAQLRQAQKLEAIGTLAGGIAHDFNNILASIIGYSELVLSDIAEDGETRSNAEEVVRAGLRARDLVKQILAFSRRSEQKRIPLRLGPLVQEALKMLRSSLPATIQVITHIPHHESPVLADPTQVQQVLMNLCTNAAQAMHPEGGRLKVELFKEELKAGDIAASWDIEPGKYMVLEVSDTGGGMKPEMLDKIFEPYYTTKEPGEGTGLGLAVVHGIVTTHGGVIDVSSQPGQGSTFRIYLPVSSETTTQEDAPSAESLIGGNESIMFVDDEESLCTAWAFRLRRLGYKVETFSDPLRAEEAFRRNPEGYDLLVTDQTMPGLLGSDLATRLMAISPQLPVVLCTGYSQVIDEPQARALGIKAFLMKPYTSNQLAETIRDSLDRRTG